MSKSTKTKEEIFRESFSLFTKTPIPDTILKECLNGGDASELQDWCVDNMKDEISDWCTGIGIIEAVAHLYECAVENGNCS